MMMLRDWNGESNKLIIDILKDYGINAEKIRLIKYLFITPDSFIWTFYLDESWLGESRYCLYAEDYVPSLEHVREAMNNEDSHSAYEDDEQSFDLVPVVEKKKWEEAAPVKSANVYAPPDDTEEFMKYATTSGYDFVFLGKGDSK